MRLLLSLTIYLILNTTAKAQVHFLDTTYAAVFAEAQLENKEVMVNVYTDHCVYCRKLDSTVYADTAFGDFINSRFLSISINAEEGFGIDFAMKYRIKMFPQVLFFDKSGHLLYRRIGYDASGAQRYINSVTYSDSTHDYLEPLPYPLDFELDYPDFYRNTFKKRSDRSFPTYKELAAFMSSRDSITDEVTWGVLSLLVTDPLYADSILKYRDLLVARFGESEVQSKLQDYVYAQVKEAIKDKNEGELNRALRKTDAYLGKSADYYKMRYQLYYYQMTGDWLAYSEMGVQLAQDTSLYNPQSLTEIAQTLYRNTNNTEYLVPALEWMQPIATADPSYNTTGTIAWLEYKLGNKKRAEKEAQEALNLAQQEKIDDTTEIEALQKMLNLAE